ncbi:MAG: hypothetical protein DLM67_10055 [Candidatus Nephthysia bennettiae]|uniref:PaaI family thioesterase n=1 Tax=Candidatus Nephthysia bennettiae TaxID=3127016 RepID=A0A934K5F4_9BACT|nr:PaaI family thioesterase [Candidatus Dormibacteraeota bacterium]MBJ7613248.1 PaaI family thioesterase [Candidatus Dormibacteraeota bacterium]PZR96063.1 MAG: hypothetical protein DLM67_10055 [Candidatus Dormibacteraeota bacterium]
MAGYERVGMWANLSAHVAEQSPGRVVVEAVLTPEAHGFPSPRGVIVHGGALAALADMALATAAASMARAGEDLATVDLKVDFMRPGRPGRIVARSSVRRRTRRLCFAETTLEQEDGTIVAEARALLAYSADSE